MPASIEATELKLEWELERLVKHLDPVLTAIDAGRRLFRVDAGEIPFARAAPHVLARIIEATCAYHRQYYNKCIDESTYRRLHNVISQHSSEFDTHALTKAKNIDLFGQRAYREQLTLQYHATKFEFARFEHIIQHAGEFAPAFQLATGVGLDFYSSYSMLLYFHMRSERLPAFRLDRGTSRHGGRIAYTDVQKYIQQLGFTPSALGQEYKRRREDIHKTYLRSLAKWVLLDRPLIATNDVLVAPFPDLIIQAAMRRLFEIADNASPEARQALNDSFETHVGLWLEELKALTGGGLSTPDSLPRGDGEPRCDYRIETDRYVLLVEAKTAHEVPLFLTEGAMRDSGVGRTIAHGFKQLVSTSKSVSNNHKPTHALLVTPFGLPFPNSDWFLKHAVAPHFDVDKVPSDLSSRPQVIAVKDFERLLCYSKALEIDVGSLIQRKLEATYATVGEWATFLDNTIGDHFVPVPSFVQSQCERMFERAKVLVGQ